MLEAIRVIVLERMNKIREISRKWNLGECPNIKKRLERLKEQQRFWHVIPASGNLFEVRSGSEEFTVDKGKRACSCKMWQLSGIPCVHAIKSMYSTVLPPKPRKMPSKPRKKRFRSVGECGSSTRVSKVGVLVRDEGACGSRGGARGSRGGASISKRVVGRSRGGFSISGGASGSKGRAASGPGGASGSRGRGASGSGSASGSRGRGVGGSKRKPVSCVGTPKRQCEKKVGTSGFAKWFGLQDEDQVRTQDEPMQSQDEDQVEQTQE
ncbi:multidrug resistance-associated protein 5 [Tanacetum coccineum]